MSDNRVTITLSIPGSASALELLEAVRDYAASHGMEVKAADGLSWFLRPVVRRESLADVLAQPAAERRIPRRMVSLMQPAEDVQ